MKKDVLLLFSCDMFARVSCEPGDYRHFLARRGQSYGHYPKQHPEGECTITAVFVQTNPVNNVWIELP